MALPKKVNKLLKDRLSLMDDSVDSMRVEDIEQDVFKSLQIFLMKELDTDKDGNIKRTSKNLKSMMKVKKLRSLVLTPEYKARVGKFIGTFNTVKSLSDDYIKEL